jgi:hypothetical protein
VGFFSSGGAGGGRGNAGGGGQPGNPGQAGSPSTSNGVTVCSGASYPVTVASGGQIVVNWNPQ